MAGMDVEVFEAESVPGGAARTLPLTVPGYLHDFGSAVHPMAAGSPFFRSLQLEQHGLEWIHGDIPLAHPFDDGTAAVLLRDLDAACAALGRDGRAWRSLLEPLATDWWSFAEDALGSLLRFPSQPFRMARFGLHAMQPATLLAATRFRDARTRALFAGLAAHSFMRLDAPFSSAVGLMLGAAMHAVGWPMPRGGAQSITQALLACLKELGGTLHTGRRIESLDQLPTSDGLVFADITPRQLLPIAAGRLSPAYARQMRRYRYGPGAYKIDYALSAPVPWSAPECRRALTVHLGGSMAEIAAAEAAVLRGQSPERPFVLVAQPSLYDSSRAPAGKHVLWAYCHVPHGSNLDMTERIEAQIERFAPGFRDCILLRRVSSPVALEAMNANLVGGDINGGAFTLRQLFLRPTLHQYATSDKHIYLCSSSTPPGGGVHGMCGYHAVERALLTHGS
jgi:phytoene dehydrogenase-like protein